MERFWAFFNVLRRVIVFSLGVVVILESLNDRDDAVAELVIGMVMVGILPLDDFLPWRRHSTAERGAPKD
jgi:hypothetical protein